MESTRFTNSLERFQDVYYFSCKILRTDLIKLIFNFTIALIHTIFYFSGNGVHLNLIKEQVNGYFSFGDHLDWVSIFFPALSSLCHYIKRKKYSKMVRDINLIGGSLKIRIIPCTYQILHYFLAIFLILEFIYEFSTEGYHMINSPTVYTYYITVWLKGLIVCQFVRELAVLRFYYRELSERLSILWAEKLIYSHKVLSSCFATLCECYSLQLTIFHIYIFTHSVNCIYLVVYSYSRNVAFGTYHNIYLIWTLLNLCYTWFVVYSCAETKYMVRILIDKIFGFNQISIRKFTNLIKNINKR